jgi:hypothetical protein
MGWSKFDVFCNDWLTVTIYVRDGSDGNSQVELQLRNQTPEPGGQQRGARLCRHHHPQNQVRSVVVLGHFSMDPDPQILTTGLRIWLRILHFSSVAFKMPTNKFFAYYFLNVRLHQYSKKKTHTKKSKTVKIKVFLTFYCLLIEGSAGCSFLRAEVFSCSLQVIRGGRPLNEKLRFFI